MESKVKIEGQQRHLIYNKTRQSENRYRVRGQRWTILGWKGEEILIELLPFSQWIMKQCHKQRVKGVRRYKEQRQDVKCHFGKWECKSPIEVIRLLLTSVMINFMSTWLGHEHPGIRWNTVSERMLWVDITLCMGILGKAHCPPYCGQPHPISWRLNRTKADPPESEGDSPCLPAETLVFLCLRTQSDHWLLSGLRTASL